MADLALQLRINELEGLLGQQFVVPAQFDKAVSQIPQIMRRGSFLAGGPPNLQQFRDYPGGFVQQVAGDTKLKDFNKRPAQFLSTNQIREAIAQTNIMIAGKEALTATGKVTLDRLKLKLIARARDGKYFATEEQSNKRRELKTAKIDSMTNHRDVTNADIAAQQIGADQIILAFRKMRELFPDSLIDTNKIQPSLQTKVGGVWVSAFSKKARDAINLNAKRKETSTQTNQRVQAYDMIRAYERFFRSYKTYIKSQTLTDGAISDRRMISQINNIPKKIAKLNFFGDTLGPNLVNALTLGQQHIIKTSYNSGNAINAFLNNAGKAAVQSLREKMANAPIAMDVEIN